MEMSVTNRPDNVIVMLAGQVHYVPFRLHLLHVLPIRVNTVLATLIHPREMGSLVSATQDFKENGVMSIRMNVNSQTVGPVVPVRIGM